jgi:5'-nucleotidase
MSEPQILLTNDDGIQSPGLWAAAEALDELGFVTVIAPRDQASGSGRSMPFNIYDGKIQQETLEVNGKNWTVHAIGGTPAIAVLYGILILLPQKPDLIVSGINYGLNTGSGVTISGTVGAALEGAAAQVPALAISLETDREYHASYSRDIDFNTAGYFTSYFSKMLLEKSMPEDVHLLKVEIPNDATSETPWQTAKLSTQRFYTPHIDKGINKNNLSSIGYDLAEDWDKSPSGTDSHTVINQKKVAVTPLSLDLTSRIDLKQFEKFLRK